MHVNLFAVPRFEHPSRRPCALSLSNLHALLTVVQRPRVRAQRRSWHVWPDVGRVQLNSVAP